MPSPLELAFTGVGATTPVGLSAPASCAALRAGVMRLGPVHSYLVDGDLIGRDPVTGGRVPTEWFDGGPTVVEWPAHERFEVPAPPPPELYVDPGEKRLHQILLPAFREALADAGWADPPPERVGLFLALSELDDPEPLRDALISELRFGATAVGEYPRGRASFFPALRSAAKVLLSGDVDVAIVAAADSRLRREALEAMDEEGALRSSSHPEGVIPGEAAGVVILERKADAEGRQKAVARLEGIVLEDEPTAGTDKPNRAEALTKVLHRLRASTPELEVPPLTVCDLNGDRYRASEWAMASLRGFADLHGDEPLWHPADCIGDAGAGLGALDTIWGITALAKGYSPQPRILVWGASDGPTRGALLLSALPAA